MPILIIDTYSNTARSLITRLRRLKTTVACNFGGVYHQDRSLCQVIVNTTKTEQEFDEWLYKTKGVNSIGSCLAKPAIECEFNIEVDTEEWLYMLV